MLSIRTEGYIRFGLTILILIVIAWILIRFRANKNSSPDSLENLRKRLERGEITKVEYETAKRK